MSSVTFKPVVFAQYRRKDGSYPVRIRITFGRKSKIVSTNLSVTQEQLTRGCKIKDIAVLEQVEDIIRKMRRSVAKLNLFALQDMDVHDISEFIVRDADSFALDFPTYAERVIAKKNAGAKNYRSAVNALTEFIGREHYDISILSSSMMRRFEGWLITRHGEGARAVSLYTQAIAHIHLLARNEYNDEELNIVNISNPFSKYTPPRQSGGTHRNAPSAIINIMLLYREDLTGRERLGVDVFLLSFALMGMNCPDIYEAKTDIAGIVTYNRHKTQARRADRAVMKVRIEPEFAWLVNEYRGSDGHLFCFAEHYVSYNNLGYAVNKGLAQFRERIGMKGELTLYVARHTFATTARSSMCGVDKSVVNDCICHIDQGMKITDLYAEKDWKTIWDANRKVQALFAW